MAYHAVIRVPLARFSLFAQTHGRSTAAILIWRVVCLGWCVCGVVVVIVELCGKWLQKMWRACFSAFFLYYLCVCIWLDAEGVVTLLPAIGLYCYIKN